MRRANIYLLVNNTGTRATTVDADLSALITSGTGTMWEFSSANMDVVVGSPTLTNGHAVFNVPGIGAILIKFGGAQPDTQPPTPNPMTWSVLPYAAGSTSITMTATTATDASGVQYFFDCTSGAGHDSGWQSGTSYTDTGLSPSTQYCYRVQARDLSPNQNATTWSTTQCATTQSGCVAGTMHVQSIVCSTVAGTQGKKKGRATVTINDNCGSPVSSANVTGTFSGSFFNETQSATTNASGVAVLTTTAQAKSPTFTFCVDNVTHATLTYDAGDNIETCDSY